MRYIVVRYRGESHLRTNAEFSESTQNETAVASIVERYGRG